MENPGDEILIDDNPPDELRKTLKEHLPAVVAEIEVALTAANLNFPVFLCIPSSGAAVASIGTPGDPSDAAWDQIDEIVRKIIAETLGLTKLCSVELACAAANYTMIGIDLIPGTANLDAIL
jgi:hypothetical protein